MQKLYKWVAAIIFCLPAMSHAGECRYYRQLDSFVINRTFDAGGQGKVAEVYFMYRFMTPSIKNWYESNPTVYRRVDAEVPFVVQGGESGFSQMPEFSGDMRLYLQVADKDYGFDDPILTAEYDLDYLKFEWKKLNDEIVDTYGRVSQEFKNHYKVLTVVPDLFIKEVASFSVDQDKYLSDRSGNAKFNFKLGRICEEAETPKSP